MDIRIKILFVIKDGTMKAKSADEKRRRREVKQRREVKKRKRWDSGGRGREMERDGERWRKMERDEERWREMERSRELHVKL